MNDFSTPESLGRHVKKVVGSVFSKGSLDNTLKLKCRYIYLHAKISAQQREGRDVSKRLMDLHAKLEEALRERGLQPSSVRGA